MLKNKPVVIKDPIYCIKCGTCGNDGCCDEKKCFNYEKIQSLEAESDRLRKSVKKYGEHLNDCQKRVMQGIKQNNILYCTCGFDDAITHPQEPADEKECECCQNHHVISSKSPKVNCGLCEHEMKLPLGVRMNLVNQQEEISRPQEPKEGSDE